MTKKKITIAEALAKISASLPYEKWHHRGIKSIWGVAWIEELSCILCSCDTYAPETQERTFFFDDGSSLNAYDIRQERGPARFTLPKR